MDVDDGVEEKEEEKRKREEKKRGGFYGRDCEGQYVVQYFLGTPLLERLSTFYQE